MHAYTLKLPETECTPGESQPNVPVCNKIQWQNMLERVMHDHQPSSVRACMTVVDLC